MEFFVRSRSHVARGQGNHQSGHPAEEHTCTTRIPITHVELAGHAAHIINARMSARMSVTIPSKRSQLDPTKGRS